jgi:hypothetical protein
VGRVDRENALPSIGLWSLTRAAALAELRGLLVAWRRDGLEEQRLVRIRLTALFDPKNRPNVNWVELCR